MLTIIEATDNGSNCDIILDRPLVNALTDDQAAFPGPYGSFNWAFHREARALVTRPMALPNKRMGVMADIAVHRQNGGTVVSLDILAGVALLDSRFAVVAQGKSQEPLMPAGRLT